MLRREIDKQDQNPPHYDRNAAKCSLISYKNRRLFYNIMRDNNYQPLCESQAALKNDGTQSYRTSIPKKSGNYRCMHPFRIRNAAKCGQIS